MLSKVDFYRVLTQKHNKEQNQLKKKQDLDNTILRGLHAKGFDPFFASEMIEIGHYSNTFEQINIYIYNTESKNQWQYLDTLPIYAEKPIVGNLSEQNKYIIQRYDNLNGLSTYYYATQIPYDDKKHTLIATKFKIMRDAELFKYMQLEKIELDSTWSIYYAPKGVNINFY